MCQVVAMCKQATHHHARRLSESDNHTGKTPHQKKETDAKSNGMVRTAAQSNQYLSTHHHVCSPLRTNILKSELSHFNGANIRYLRRSRAWPSNTFSTRSVYMKPSELKGCSVNTIKKKLDEGFRFYFHQHDVIKQQATSHACKQTQNKYRNERNMASICSKKSSAVQCKPCNLRYSLPNMLRLNRNYYTLHGYW